jgi:tetraacyldisaccharide 4'-kinase
VDVIVMDDGHQNPSLHKDVSIVVVDSAEAFGNGFVLPKGPLQEPVNNGLARAHAVLLAGTGDVPEPVIASGKPVLRFQLKPGAHVPDGPLLAFAGIGRPLKFFDALKAAGGDVQDGIAFDDHHVFTQGDLNQLVSHAAHLGARLITTEKDHVRLPGALRAQVLTFPVQAIFESDDMLDELLRGAVTER